MVNLVAILIGLLFLQKKRSRADDAEETFSSTGILKPIPDALRKLPEVVAGRVGLMVVVAVVIILIWGYRPFPPSLLGKMTTFFQIVLVFTVVLGAAYPNALLDSIKQILIYLVAALATVSAFHYSVNIARNLSSPAHPPAKPGPAADRDNAKS